MGRSRSNDLRPSRICDILSQVPSIDRSNEPDDKLPQPLPDERNEKGWKKGGRDLPQEIIKEERNRFERGEPPLKND